MFLLSWWRASVPANRGHKRTPPIMLTEGPEKPKREHERRRPDRRTPIVALFFEFLRFATSRVCYAQILCRYFTIFSFRFSVLMASPPRDAAPQSTLLSSIRLLRPYSTLTTLNSSLPIPAPSIATSRNADLHQPYHSDRITRVCPSIAP